MTVGGPVKDAGGAADTVLCVFCRRHPADDAWRPFCSKRCQTADLARWADGSYRVAGTAVPESGPPDDTEEPT